MTPPIHSQQFLAADDEISLSDLWRTLIQGWRWIIGGTIVGAAAAVGYLAITPPQYEAMVLVQIGQAGQVGQAGLAPVESLARVVERVMFPTFKDAMVKKLGWSGDPRGVVYASSLKATIAKGSDLIELRVRGLTREDTASSLNATVEHLSQLHREVAQPAIESLQSELKEISAEARQAGKVMGELERAARFQNQLAPRDRFSESMLYAQLFATNESRIRELRRRESQYREWISLTGKAVTAAFAEPMVSDAPVSPRKAQTLVLGALGGMLFGVVAVLFRHIRRPGPIEQTANGRLE
jgi:uncharacterized protein involved in exopolysaccharide biosynthesis